MRQGKANWYCEKLESRRLLTSLPQLILPAASTRVPAQITASVADPVLERFYAIDQTNQSVRVIDATAGTQLQSVSLTGTPNLVQITPDGQTLLVSISSRKQIDVISTQSWQRLRSIEVPEVPLQIVPVAGFSFYATYPTGSAQSTRYSLVRYNYDSGVLTQTIVTNNNRRIMACTDATGRTLFVRGHVPLGQRDRIAVFDALAISPVIQKEFSFAAELSSATAYAMAIDSVANQLYTTDESSLNVHVVNLNDQSIIDWSMEAFRENQYSYLSGPYSILSAPGSKYLYVGFGSSGWAQVRKSNGKLQAKLAVSERASRSPRGVFLSYYSWTSTQASNTDITLAGTELLTLPDEYPRITGTLELDSNGNGYGDRKDTGLAEAILFADLDDDGVRDETEASTSIRTYSADATPWELFLPGAGTYNLLIAYGDYGAQPVIETSTRQTRFTFGAHQRVVGPRITLANAASAYGMIFFDSNADNEYQGGEVEAATKVYLDLNENGQLDNDEPLQFNRYATNEPHVASTRYSFYLIPKRHYVIRALPLDGAPFVGGVDHFEVQLGTGSVQERDFAIDRRQSLQGKVVEDLDHDGKIDHRELPLTNVTVWFDLDNDRKVDSNEPSSVTDAQGNYRIELAHDVFGIAPSFRTSTARYFSASSQPYYGSDDLVTTVDFAVYHFASVEVTAFDDVDQDGRFTSGDHHLSGSKAFVDLNYNGSLDKREPSQILDTSGHATFANVATGTARVIAIAPRGDDKTYAANVVVAGTSTAVSLTGSAVDPISSNPPPYGPLSTGSANANFRIGAMVADPVRNRVYVSDFSYSTIRVIDTDVGKQVASLVCAGSPIEMSVTPDGSSLLVTLDSSRVQVFSLLSLTTLRVMNTALQLTDVGAGAGNVFYAVASDNFAESLCQFDLFTGALRSTVRTLSSGSGTEFWSSADGVRLTIASDWTADEPVAVFEYDISDPNAVTLLNVHSGTSNLVLDTTRNRLYGTTPATDGSLSVALGDSNARLTWPSHHEAADYDPTSLDAHGVAMSTDGQWVYSLGAGPMLSVYSAEQERVVYRYPLRYGNISMLAVTPNGHVVYMTRISDSSAASEIPNYDGYDYGLGIIGSQTLSLPGNPAVVLGNVYNDLNANGHRDSKDTNFLDAIVYVDLDGNRKMDELEPRTGVAGNGEFAIELPTEVTGTLQLRLSEREGHTQLIFPSESSATVSIQAGEQVGGVLLGAVYGALIRCEVVFDDSEFLGDNRVYPELYLDLNNNNVRDTGEALAGVTSFDTYSFLVKPGSYHLRFTDGRYVRTKPEKTVTVKADQDVFTSISVQPLRIMQGQLFHDLNANGIRDGSEASFAMATVWVDGNSNGKLDNNEAYAVSDSDGRYVLHGQKDGWSRPIRFRSNGSTLVSTATRKRVQFTNPDVWIKADFGLFNPATINVFTFLDNDGNRKWNKGDRALAGVMIYIDRDDDGKQDKNEIATITDAFGSGTFSSLPPGNYVVRVRVPSSMAQTTRSVFTVGLPQQGSAVSLQTGLQRH